jgi:hypothetical protein
MDKATADWYVQHTDGQFQAFMGEDGQWYLYTPKPKPIGIQPKIPTDRDRP